MRHLIVDQEHALLEQVNAVLSETSTAARPSEAAIVKELEELRAMLVEGGEEKDRAAITQQWDRQSALLKQLRESRQAPEVDRYSPYFAHLRLREGKEEWDICLGKATRIERGVRIVDWRNAPISRIFYRYQQGEDYEEELAGRNRNGQVVARRTVAIRNGRLERVEAPEATFVTDETADGGWRELPGERARLVGGQGSAFRAYGAGEGSGRRLGTDLEGSRRRVDKHLPDIAGLIDPEQFNLITRPSSGMVVIRGTAGSGKTTVTLHRIAYLAYDDPKIDSEHTLVVVFSPALRNYVSHVLPALGVNRVRVLTFREWSAEQCRRLFPMLPAARRENTPAAVHRLKLHPIMQVALAEQVRRHPGPATVRQVVDDWASAGCQHELLREVFGALAPDAFTAEELQRAADWNRERHDELIAWLRGESTEQPDRDPEDDALLLRAWQLRVGPLTGKGQHRLRYRHIAIDEVQDFSPLEVRVLFECLDDKRSMTLAGDTQQHVMQDAGFTSWDGFFEHLGVAGTAVDTLRVAYRSTQEIVTFAMDVLGPLREDEAPPITTRTGPPVELFRFTDHGACVAFLADALKDLLSKEPLASVAILTPSAQISGIYHQGLANSEVPRLHRVQDQDFRFAPGVEVTEIEQVKGLEFDYVICVETSTSNFPDNPSARRLLHVAATRAVHQLWLTSVGTPSVLVRASLPTAG